MPTEPLVVVAEFEIRPGHEEEFRGKLLELGVDPCIEREPGCLLLWAHQDPAEPTRFLLYEHWADRAGFEASFHRPWRAAYAEATEQLWAKPRRTTTWELLRTLASTGDVPAHLGTLEEPER